LEASGSLCGAGSGCFRLSPTVSHHQTQVGDHGCHHHLPSGFRSPDVTTGKPYVQFDRRTEASVSPISRAFSDPSLRSNSL